MHVVLYEPEIPPNTGNIMRLCANTGVQLHLIEPLGFQLDEKALRRAGLDYRDTASVRVHVSLEECLQCLNESSLNKRVGPEHPRVFAVTTKGEHQYHEQHYQAGDVLLFGPESRGLPENVLYADRTYRRIRIPMMPGSRSVNLATAVSIVVYEALRQQAFKGLI